MRTISLRFLSLFLSVCVLSLLLLGCGGGSHSRDDDEDDTKPGASRSKGESKSSASEKKPISGELVSISGVVKLEGARPDDKLARLTEELQKGMKQDRDYCLTGSPSEKSEQEYRIGKNNQVGNVFVWIEPEKGYYFAISEEQLKEIPKEKHIRQPHCAFIPHCEVVFPKYTDSKGKVNPTGQKLIVENDAKVAHNTKTLKTARNNPTNETLQVGKHARIDLIPDNEAIRFECSIHTWMNAYVRAFNHPYATVSVVGKEEADQEYGSWKIQAPLGAKVRIYAWHEKAGFLTDSKGDPIEITKDFKKDFTMKAP